MSVETILLIILVIAVGYLYVEKLIAKKTAPSDLPELKPGERLAIVRKGESNLTLKRTGTKVAAIDEEGAEIPLQITRE